MVKTEFDADDEECNKRRLEEYEAKQKQYENFSCADFHEKAVLQASEGKLGKAVDTCIWGLMEFPLDMNLLSDVIRFSSDNRQMGVAQTYFDMLYELVPRSCWKDGAYASALSYLTKNPKIHESICRELIKDYKTAFPGKENPVLFESNLEVALGNIRESKQLLKKNLLESKQAPKCAIRLFELQIRSGEFEDAIQTSDYYLAADFQENDMEEYFHHLDLRCLLEDSVLRQKYMEKGSITQKDYIKMQNLYEKMLEIPAIKENFLPGMEEQSD